MLVRDVNRSAGHWAVHGFLDECLQLTAVASHAATIEIGTIGTRRRSKVSGGVTVRFAQVLAKLERPVMLIDIRRTGSGGSGSWGPLELGTKIPRLLSELTDQPYAYYHLPIAAPSTDLLDKWRNQRGVPEYERFTHWNVFRDAYTAELPHAGILAGRAFVEAAHLTGGIAVFLCAEEYCADFEEFDASQQDGCYCHRFTYAHQIGRMLIKQDICSSVRRVDLAIENEAPDFTTLSFQDQGSDESRSPSDPVWLSDPE